MSLESYVVKLPLMDISGHIYSAGEVRVQLSESDFGTRPCVQLKLNETVTYEMLLGAGDLPIPQFDGSPARVQEAALALVARLEAIAKQLRELAPTLLGT